MVENYRIAIYQSMDLKTYFTRLRLHPMALYFVSCTDLNIRSAELMLILPYNKHTVEHLKMITNTWININDNVAFLVKCNIIKLILRVT